MEVEAENLEKTLSLTLKSYTDTLYLITHFPLLHHYLKFPTLPLSQIVDL